MDSQSFIKENDHLKAFDWKGAIVDHTEKERKGRRYLYPNYCFVPSGQGIYIFSDRNFRCLYVGQAKNRLIVERLKDRFKEMHGQGHKDYPDHTTFFQKHQDSKMLILTTKIQDSLERDRVESYLTAHLKPLFIEYQKEFKKNNLAKVNWWEDYEKVE